MGIGGIASTNSMSVMQMTAADLKDQKSKSIQTEITNTQRQIQKLSSEEDLSAYEKANEQKKLQKEISGLNTELKQHQEELRRSQKREIMLARLLEDAAPAKEETSEDKIQSNETSSDTADKKVPPADRQQAAPQGTATAGSSDGRVILKGAVQPDQNRDTDAETKQADEAKEETADVKETKITDNDTTAEDKQSGREMHAMVSADSFLQQADRQGTVVTRTRDGIAILKGEIKLDEYRDTDTERKQAELKKMEQQEQREMEFQFSLLGEANRAMKPAAESSVSVNNQAQANTQNNLHVSGSNLSQEEQTAQQQFYVSFV